VVDPVCGMRVDPATSKRFLEYKGTTYYFCGPRCLERFTADPESFLAKKKTEATPAKPGVNMLAALPAVPWTLAFPIARWPW